MNSKDEWVEIGKIVAPQGLKGEVRVYPDSDFPERFERPGERWLLRVGETQPQLIRLKRGYYIPRKNLYVIQLEGVDDIDRAEALRGAILMVKASDRPKLQPGEYHILDLVGLEVFNPPSEESLGVVIGIIPAGNDLLEVKLHSTETSEKAKSILIPFVKEIVPLVDIQNNRIEITPPPGLLEI